MPKYRQEPKISRRCNDRNCYSCKSGSFAGNSTYGWCIKFGKEVKYNASCELFRKKNEIKINIINIDL